MLAASNIWEGVNTSETSVNFSQTTRRNIPEDSHLLIVNLVYILVCAKESQLKVTVIKFTSCYVHKGYSYSQSS
jgi:hypothetical protein